MHDFVELVRALAWPGVVLTAILLLRAALAGLIEQTAEFLQRTKSVKAKAFGVALDLAAEIAQHIVPPAKAVSGGVRHG